MQSRVILLLLLLFLRPVSMPGVALGSSADASGGSTSITWTFATEDLKLAAGWRDTAEPFPSLAIESPWLAAGPLAPAGLLREVRDPLGFSAGSDVFHERTGLALDLSALGGRVSFACQPVPGALGFFCIPVTDECLTFGSFATASLSEWLELEAVVQVEDTAPAAAVSEWFPDKPLDPGGSLVQFASRIRTRASGFSASGSIGCSCSEKAPPGCFLHLDSEYKTGPVEAALLVGMAGEGYRAPAGRTAGARGRVSGTIGLHSLDDAAEVRCIIDLEPAGFVPRACLAESEELSATWERDFRLARGVKASVRVEARKEISFDEWAFREEEPSASATLGVESKLLGAQGVLSWSASNGMQVSGLFAAEPVDFLRIEVEVGTSCLSAVCTVRDRERRQEISVRAGVTGGELSFGLSWKTAEGEAAGSARNP